MEVKDLIRDCQWNEEVVHAKFTYEWADFVLKEIRSCISELNDTAWWTGNSSGRFTVKSTFDIIKKRKEIVNRANNVRTKALPHKISFFLWRLMNRRVSTDDVLRTMGISIVSKCCYCDIGCAETLNHLFLTAPIAQKLWKHFATCAGFKMEDTHITLTYKSGGHTLII